MENKKQANEYLRQSFEKAWENYKEILENQKKCNWDYLVLTASNNEQAMIYTEEIAQRKENNQIPENIEYLVVPDPGGKRVGSGGATLNVLKLLYDEINDKSKLKNKRILIIHSGGDSKRIPQYSPYGKLFTPIPRLLPNGSSSTIFDELFIMFSVVAGNIEPGVLCVSGDVLLECNPFDIILKDCDSACVAIKEEAPRGCNHGVFLGDENAEVKEFLHKKSLEKLAEYGAIDNENQVDIDTGTIYFGSKIIVDLIEMLDKNEENKFINDIVRINLYGDIVYPLANNSTLERYIKEAPEGKMSEELLDCRNKIWNVLNKYNMKILKLEPAKFIHIGTTNELISIVAKEIDEHRYMNWKRQILTNMTEMIESTINNVLVSENPKIGKDSYIENTYIGEKCVVGENVVISNSTLDNIVIPDNVCISTVKLKSGKYVTRIYSIIDNFKQEKLEEIHFLGTNFGDFVKKYNVDTKLIWEDELSLWEAQIYQVCETENESVRKALKLYQILHCDASLEETKEYFSKPRISCQKSFTECDIKYMRGRKREIEMKVRTENFIKMIENKENLFSAVKLLEENCDKKAQLEDVLSKINENMKFETRYRIYLALSIMLEQNKEFEDLCFEEIKNMLSQDFEVPVFGKIKDKAETELPIRVNFGGGWTDTPPYCNENGGSVLNAAFELNGEKPVRVYIEKNNENSIILESKDLKISKKITCIEELKDTQQESDNFKIHKTALIITGIVREEDERIEDVVLRIGNGFTFSTYAKDIPKGSGLGTSSILAGACLKTLYDFLGVKIDDKDLCNKVLLQEQLMGTGGGWQDQIGGLIPGIKLTMTKQGMIQEFDIQQLNLSQQFVEEFNLRFVLIYTGQQRVAKNLLRTIMGKYIMSEPEILDILEQIRKMSVCMKIALEKENLDEFAEYLSKHWELSKKLDEGCSNDNIERIFEVCDDLIQGKMICGAGGGGFLQVVLKKGVAKEVLEERIRENFIGKDVKVYEAKLV